jgi:hypothetical protein
MNIYIIIFIILVFLVILLRNHNENFPYYYDMYDKRYCKNCNSRSILDCDNCFNCGICIKDNISTCESGDIDGPDTKQCDKWIYNSDQVIFNNYNPYYNPYYNSYNPYYNPYYYRYNDYPYYYRYNDYPYYRTKNKSNKENKYNKENKSNKDNKPKDNKPKDNKPKENKVVRSSKYNLDVLGRGKK